MTTHDAEWLDDDRGYSQAYRRNKAGECPGGCGLPLEETTDPANEGAYEAPLPTRCHACTSLEHQKTEYEKNPPGLLFQVRMKDEKA